MSRFSAACGVALHAPWIRRRVEEPSIPGYRAYPAQGPRRPYRHLVPTAAKALDRVRADPVLYVDRSRR